jgi:hypothetical protein
MNALTFNDVRQHLVDIMRAVNDEHDRQIYRHYVAGRLLTS